MTTITLTVDEQRAAELRAAAEQLGISAEDLISQGVEEFLARRNETVRAAAAYVLRKNTGLYRRLA
jgi:hypothetical protein